MKAALEKPLMLILMLAPIKIDPRALARPSCNLLKDFGPPCWRHFRLKWGNRSRLRPICYCVDIFSDLLAVLTPPWRRVASMLASHGRHLGPIWEVFAAMLAPFWCEVGTTLGKFGARAGTGWAGGVTRSERNFVNIHNV